jgi:uncharacterized protein (DUF1697 family)
MARLVGLLRGINLGAKRRIAMADLRALLTELGYEDVRTVLASGNIIFTGPKAKAREKLEQAIAERFGFQVDVVLRTMAELHSVVADEPFGEEIDNDTRYFVVFLPSTPDVSSLDGQDFAPDKFAANGREIYAWCPDGMQNSRLMKALGKPHPGATTATVRNMATVKKLLE